MQAQFDSRVRKIHWRRDRLPTPAFLGFPCGSVGKESTCNVGDLGSIPGLGRSPGEGKGYPLQYSGLENSIYSETWRRERLPTSVFLGFPCGSVGKESTCKAGDLGSIPGLGRSPPFQYSDLDISRDCIFRGVAKSLTGLSDFHFHR